MGDHVFAELMNVGDCPELSLELPQVSGALQQGTQEPCALWEPCCSSYAVPCGAGGLGKWWGCTDPGAALQTLMLLQPE